MKGTLCKICTGCGRCTGDSAGLFVLTESAFMKGTDQGKNCANRDYVLVDIGTTTVAMVLLGRDGEAKDTFLRVNPQAEYGADVLSRILAAQDKTAAARMRQLIREVLKEGLCRFRKLLPADSNIRMILAANTTMTYLLLGHDTEKLGRAPFTAEYLQGVETQIEGVDCYIFPGISAFVGGDILSGMYGIGMLENEEITLLVDLGTNGELVLGNKEKRICCSTAAGPAFEGGVSKGIWGADMVSLVARLLREGIVDETGLLADAFFEEGVRIGNVCVTQQAIRQLQLAKAAIATGMELLVREYGISMKQIDRVILSGGLGYYLKPEDAVLIGLLPGELLGKSTAGGNTALAGAARLAFACPDEEHFRQQNHILQNAATVTRTIPIPENPEFEELFLKRINLGLCFD